MARYIEECNAIIRNLSQELRSRCPTDDQYCCYLHCCFVNRQPKELWETWYFWFGVALIALLLTTSAASFIVGMCSRKSHQLIRVHHRTAPAPALATAEGGHCAAGAVLGVTLASAAALAAPVTAVTGPDGLIQPYVAGAAGLPVEVATRYKAQGTATAIFRGDSRRANRSRAGSVREGSAEVVEGGSGSASLDQDVDGEVDDGEDVAGPLEPAYPPMQPVTIVRGPLPEGGFRHTEAYTELVLPPGYVDPHPGHKRPP